MPVGFDYSVFDTGKFDEVADVDFIATIKSTASTPQIRFTYGGSDYSDFVISISNITRRSDLTPGSAIITLDNTEGTFSGFLTGALYFDDCTISIHFGTGTYLTIFKGMIFNILYTGTQITITLIDKSNTWLDVPIGTGSTPVTLFYEDFHMYPSYLAWEILTTYAGLDDTESTDNLDIDYTSWVSWDYYVTTEAYTLEIRSTGNTVRDLLSYIAELSTSYISLSSENKVRFYPGSVSGTFYGNTDVSDLTYINGLQIDAEIRNESLIADPFWGYDIATGLWDGPALPIETSEKVVRFDNKNVWHKDETSAMSFKSNYQAIHVTERKFIKARVPFWGILINPGDRISFTETQIKFVGQKHINVLNINIDLESYIVDIEGELTD